MSEPSSSDLSRWRQLVEQTLRGASFERRMVRALPGGLSLPALQTGRPNDAAASALVVALSREGRWEVCAEHSLDHADALDAIERDIDRGADSIRFAAANPEGVAAALERVDLSETGVVWQQGGTLAERLAVVQAATKRQGVSTEQVWGAIGADPYARLLTTGTNPPDAGWWDGVAQCVSQRPRHLAVVGLTGLGAREAGASAVTELGALLASAAATFRALGQRGLAVADVAAAARISVGLGRDQLVGLALLRAVRLTMARLGAAFGEPQADRTRMTVHGYQLRCWQTRHDPWVNLLRSTMAGFVGAAGGADAITLLPYDGPGGGTSTLGRRMATNTQVLLAEESHLAVVRDPAAGSYTVEHLTLELARAAWDALQAIEAAGGIETDAGRAVLVARVASERAALATDLDRRKAALVGVSDFPGSADQALARSVGPAEGGLLMPMRHAATWEDLRDAAEARPDLPPVFLATWGPLARHSARAMFTANLLAAGGLQAVDPGGATQVDALVAAFQNSGGRACVICGADADYPDVVPELAAALRDAGADAVWLAGRPGAHEASWRAAGVTDFIYTGCNVRARLADLHRLLDIPESE